MNSESILLSELDLYRLNAVVGEQVLDHLSDAEIEILSDELDRAEVIGAAEVPPDLVTMNSKVQYLNFNDNTVSEITIVYPHLADTDMGLISVTAPLGAALLGLREYEEIEWPFPDGRTKKLKVLEIIYQPEKNGDLHL